MSREFAIFTLCAMSLPALAAPAENPLQRSIALIRGMQSQDELIDASKACDDALPLAEDPATTAAERALLFTTCGDVHLRTGDLAKSRALLESALSLWTKMLGATDAQVAVTSLDLALVYRLTGWYELAEQLARRALAIDEASYGPKSPMLTRALISLGTAESMLGRYADAELNLNRALSLLLSGYGREGLEAAQAHSSLGLLYFRQGRYLEAEQSYRRAGAIPGSGPDSARTLAGLARVYLATARYDKADTACSKALDLLTRSLTPLHSEVAATLLILAQVRRSQERYAEEAELLKQALDLTVRVSGPDRLNESIILNSIGVSYNLQRRYAEAEGQFRKAIRIQEKLGGDARRDLSMTLHNLAFTCNKQGRYSEALDLATRALATCEADLPNVDSTVLDIMLHKAELLRKVHCKTEAAKLERAARQARASLNSEKPDRWVVDFRELQGKK